MPKLTDFDVKAWRKGFAADIYAYDPNARDVNDNPIPGKVLVHTLRYKTPKKVADDRPIKPQITALTKSQTSKRNIITHPTIANNDDVNGRTLEGHRAQVELYAQAYANGFDPLTGADLRDVQSFEFYDEDDDLQINEKHVIGYRAIDEFKSSQKHFTPPAYSVGRNVKVMENDGMALLTQCFANRFADED